MPSVFREEPDDVATTTTTTHQADTAHAAGGSGAQPADDISVTASTNASTANTGDHIISNTPVRRELTREKIVIAAKKSKEWGISHIKHKWKWYLVGFVIFLAVLLPIIFLVALPAVVQLIVNQQNLPARSGALIIQDPNTIRITLDTLFKIPPGLQAKTNEFDLLLYDHNAPEFSPFLTVQAPSLNLKGGDNNFTIQDQVQHITDLTSLSEWFAKFYDQEIVGLGVRGNGAEISIGALKSYPRLDKTIPFTGLDGLRGVSIETLNFLFPPQNGMNIRGSLILPNRSPLKLSMGDLAVNVESGDIKTGSIFLKNVDIAPGNHSEPFEGFLDFQAILGNLSGFLKTQSAALGTGNVQLNVTARSITRNGEHIAFLENVLKTRPITVDVSVVTLLTDLLSGLFNSGGKVTGGGPQNGTAFVNALSGIFSNNTLLNNISGHWKKSSQRGSGKHISERSLLGDSTMWNLMKLGLKMKAMQK